MLSSSDNCMNQSRECVNGCYTVRSHVIMAHNDMWVGKGYFSEEVLPVRSVRKDRELMVLNTSIAHTKCNSFGTLMPTTLSTSLQHVRCMFIVNSLAEIWKAEALEISERICWWTCKFCSERLTVVLLLDILKLWPVVTIPIPLGHSVNRDAHKRSISSRANHFAKAAKLHTNVQSHDICTLTSDILILIVHSR